MRKLKSTLQGGRQLLDEREARCSCGAAGKPFMTMDGNRGFVCERCFVRELLVVTQSRR